MTTTHQLRTPVVVQLKKDFPRYGWKAQESVECNIDILRHGVGYQMYRVDAFTGRAFHASFKDEDEFNESFEVIGTQYMGTLTPATLTELKRQTTTNK